MSHHHHEYSSTVSHALRLCFSSIIWHARVRCCSFFLYQSRFFLSLFAITGAMVYRISLCNISFLWTVSLF